MGARANIIVNTEICLYSHWDGENLAIILQDALDRGKERWNDAPYLTRIIFCEMIKDNVMSTTGYGISTHIEDNDYPFIWVDIDTNTVYISDQKFSFEEYVNMSKDLISNLMLQQTSDHNYVCDLKEQRQKSIQQN